MTFYNPPNGGDQSDSIRLIHIETPDAEEAFAVYSALARLAVDNPTVGRLPMMAAMRQRAYQAFNAAFEVDL